MVNLTGITWIISSAITAFVAWKMYRGLKSRPNPLLNRFTWFFIFVTASFVLFALTLFTEDPYIVKYVALFGGRAVLFVGLLFVANVPRMLVWKNLPVWLIPGVFVIGSIAHFYSLHLTDLPYTIHTTYFSLTQWNVDTLNFLIYFGVIGLVTIPLAITLIKSAASLSKEVRFRSLGIAIALVVGTVAGTATGWNAQPVNMLIASHLVLLAAFIFMFITLATSSVVKEELEG